MNGRAAPRVFLGALLVVLTVWLCRLQPWDPDTWWHLRTGQLILETGKVPKTDPYSYVLAGGPWVTFEWLADVVFFLAWKAWPAGGIAAVKTACVALGALGTWAVGGAGAWAFLAVSGGWLGLHGFFTNRPQAFDYALVPLFLYLARRPRAGAARWLLPALSCVWANLHGGAAFVGAGLLALRAALAFARPPREKDADGWRTWAALSAGCAAAVLLTPHGLRILGHTSGTLLFKHREQIGEWEPFHQPLSLHGALLALTAAAVVDGWREEPFLAAAAAALGALSISAVRHEFLFALAALPFLARLLERRRPFSGRWPAAAAAAGAVAALSALLIWRYAEYTPTRPGDVLDHPDQAIQWLDDHGVEGRMFHSYEAGGYLIWRGYPRRQVFVDGRNVEYGPDFIARVIHWERPGAFRELDARWGFDYAVLLNSQDYKAKSLDEDPRWTLVFFDDAGLVYLKREPRNAALIERFAYKRLRPNEPEFGYLKPLLADKKTRAQVLAEIERGLAGSPHNLNAHEMKAFALAAIGREAESLAELKRAVELFPDKPSPYMALGWWYETNGRLDEARRTYERGRWVARRLPDFFSEAYIDNNLAMVEDKLGRRDEAVRLLKRAIWAWPQHPNAAVNLARLEGPRR